MTATSTAATASQTRRPFRVLFGSLRTQLTLALMVPSVIAVFALTFGSVSLAQQAANDQKVTSVLEMGEIIRDFLDAVNGESHAAFGLSGMSYDDAAAKTDASLAEIYTAIDERGDSLPASLLALQADLREQGVEQTEQLRMYVKSGQMPPAGVLGIFANMRAMTTQVPQDFATEVSNEQVRNQLSAMAQSWAFSSRLDTEEILLNLWLRQHEAGAPAPSDSEAVQPADIAAAIRETDVVEKSVDLSLSKVDTEHDTGLWSEDVAAARQMLAASDGLVLNASMVSTDTLGSYLTQVTRRSIDTHATAHNIVDDAKQLAADQDVKSKFSIVLSVSLIVVVIALAVWMLIMLSRRIINPIVALVGVTKRRAQDLPRQLEAIERGGTPAVLDPIKVPKAGPELQEFAGGLNDLVETAVELATKEAQQRAAVVGMLRTVAHREAALVNRQLELLDKYERHEVDPVFLSRLFNLDHVTTQMRRMCDSLLVLAGASPVRRTTPPLSLVDVVRGASSQIQQYSRVDLDVWYDPRVHGHKVSDLTLLLAELLDNATKYSHPDTRVTVTFTRGTDAALVTIADEGIGFDDAAISTAQGLVDATDPDHFAMFDRLGLQTVARLCQRTGASVSFAGGTDVAGTRVSVRIPDVLLADPGAGVSMRLATAQAGETFDDAVNRPASMTLYGQQQ